MRKSEREVCDRTAIDAIIRKSEVCRLGLCDGGEPYVVPLCFGYDGQAVYFHGAREGRKLEMLQRNPRVCCEFDVVLRFVPSEEACRWTVRYQSVIAVGTAAIIEDIEEKRHALATIMAQYTQGNYSFPAPALERVCVIKVTLERVTGKQSVD